MVDKHAERRDRKRRRKRRDKTMRGNRSVFVIEDATRRRAESIRLTDHKQDHDSREEWLALTRFVQPINPDPLTQALKHRPPQDKED